MCRSKYVNTSIHIAVVVVELYGRVCCWDIEKYSCEIHCAI